MIADRQQLRQHASTLQRRAAAMTALFMTIFLLCIEHVRAFANHYHITAHDAMVLASAASSLTRKLSKTYLSGDVLKKNLPTSYGIFTSASSTQLNAWSIPAIAMPVMPTMPTSKEMPIHTLWSWYEKVDPTTKPPVYDDEYDSSYSFGSPTDDWPSMSVDEEATKAVQAHMRRGPLNTIRRVAGRFKDIIVQ